MPKFTIILRKETKERLRDHIPKTHPHEVYWKISQVIEEPLKRFPARAAADKPKKQTACAMVSCMRGKSHSEL